MTVHSALKVPKSLLRIFVGAAGKMRYRSACNRYRAMCPRLGTLVDLSTFHGRLGFQHQSTSIAMPLVLPLDASFVADLRQVNTRGGPPHPPDHSLASRSAWSSRGPAKAVLGNASMLFLSEASRSLGTGVASGSVDPACEPSLTCADAHLLDMKGSCRSTTTTYSRDMRTGGV